MTDFERNKARVTAEYEALINRKNIVSDSYNGIYDRYVYPVLTAAHAPIIWKYDMNPETNPYFMERLGINAVLNSGAIYLNGKYYLVARVEGNDRKSFFAVAESDSPVDGFRFWDFPVQLPDTEPEETNVYDMRLTQHEARTFLYWWSLRRDLMRKIISSGHADLKRLAVLLSMVWRAIRYIQSFALSQSVQAQRPSIILR